VDGIETPILRADYLFRAIALPPGAHEVRFVFVPMSLQRGWMLSAAGILIALSAMLVGIGGPLARLRPWRRLIWVRRIWRQRSRRRPGAQSPHDGSREQQQPASQDDRPAT
jgi:hypothetical protein